MKQTATLPARYLALRRTSGDLELWTEGDLEMSHGYGSGAPRRPSGSWQRGEDGRHAYVPAGPEELAAYEAALKVWVDPTPPAKREIRFASVTSRAGSLAKRLRRVADPTAAELTRLDAEIAERQAARAALIERAWSGGTPLGVEEVCAVAATVSEKLGASRSTMHGRLSPTWSRPGAKASS
jgi:hypothetical protein